MRLTEHGKAMSDRLRETVFWLSQEVLGRCATVDKGEHSPQPARAAATHPLGVLNPFQKLLYSVVEVSLGRPIIPVPY